jgi:hypothetical protein
MNAMTKCNLFAAAALQVAVPHMIGTIVVEAAAGAKVVQ